MTDTATRTAPESSARPLRLFSEATAVARAQDGDTAAFEQLVRDYESELFRLAYRMLGDRGDAQDALQDTFVLTWRRLPSLTDPQAFRAWIYQLATRRCLNLLRVRTRRRTDVGVPDDTDNAGDTGSQTPIASGSTDSPAATAQTHALQDGLTVALAGLPSEQRACWVLHHLHDLSYPAIAYAIGIPVSTVRGRIARARAQLAKGMTAWR